jgi:4-amino-4-deoxy-L-arabinose transferase-like glycosyltransferase
MLLCTSVALGFLAKGSAVLIPCGAMFIFLVVTRGAFRYFFSPWSLLGILIFVLIGLTWYIWLSFKIHGAFNYFLDSQIFGRLFTAKYRRNPGLTGALIYLPVLVFGSLPWSIIFLEKKHLLMSSLFCKQWWKRLPHDPQRLFLLSYFFVPLVVLSLASSKLGLYALPIFVPLAIAAAKLWMQKAPVHEYPSFRGFLTANRRPITLVASWIVLLLISRLALAWYPTADNMKTLWAQLDKNLPAGDYEMCTIDERADGLLFYGARNLEHITSKEHPYPTFTPIETVIQQLRQKLPPGRTLLFIVIEDDDVVEAVNTLNANGVKSRIIRLPHHRALLFPSMEDIDAVDRKKQNI